MTKATTYVSSNILLVDGDAILYPAGFIAASRSVSLEDTYENVRSKLLSYGDHFQPDTMTWYFTGQGSPKWRDQFKKAIPYKEHRKAATVKPEHIGPILNGLKRNFPEHFVYCEVVHGEADDYICTDAHWGQKVKRSEVTIVHTDKDLDQIPGRHYNVDLTKMTYEIDEVTGLQHKYAQILSGDAADNIPGLPGIGAKRAAQAMQECVTEKDMFDKSFEMYVKRLGSHGYDDESIISLYYETANLVHLRRNLQDDCWTPPE